MRIRTLVQISILVSSVTCNALSNSWAQQVSEFGRVCRVSMESAEAFLSACKENARPFKRNFYPGGQNPPVLEQHAAWFDVAHGGSHFGFGCVIGPRDQVRYLGLYFFINESNFSKANSAQITFVDFNGNVGLRTPEGANFTLLAIRRFTLPGHQATIRDRTCELGSFDPESNETIEKPRNGFYNIIKVSETNPATITHCVDREIRYEKSRCSTREFASFLDSTKSAITYNETLIKITERARLYVATELLSKACIGNFRPMLEVMNFAKEVCALQR